MCRAAASQELLIDLLRGELGFDGVVVTDYFTVDTLHAYHRIATDEGDAARRALEAGLDVELPAIDCYGAPLREALDRGAVAVALVDPAVRRLLRTKFELGLFERPYVDAAAAPLVFDTAPQRALARELAPEVDRAAEERARPASAAEDAAPSRGDRTIGDEHPRAAGRLSLSVASGDGVRRDRRARRRRVSSPAGSASTSARTSCAW